MGWFWFICTWQVFFESNLSATEWYCFGSRPLLASFLRDLRRTKPVCPGWLGSKERTLSKVRHQISQIPWGEPMKSRELPGWHEIIGVLISIYFYYFDHSWSMSGCLLMPRFQGTTSTQWGHRFENISFSLPVLWQVDFHCAGTLPGGTAGTSAAGERFINGSCKHCLKVS